MCLFAAPVRLDIQHATGNRTSLAKAGVTTAYSYPASSHRLSQVGSTARTYDAVGNTASIGGTAKTFSYNNASRLAQVSHLGVAKRSYAYNGKGEQVPAAVWAAPVRSRCMTKPGTG